MWRTTPVEQGNLDSIRCNGTHTKEQKKEIVVTEVGIVIGEVQRPV